MMFSEILRRLREEQGISQEAVARYLGITRQGISCFELGKREPDYRTLKKLADYFNVSIDYLLGRSDYHNVSADLIGKNIEIIKGNLSYKDFSESLREKTGATIYPDMLEHFVKGDRKPFIGVIRIISQYASVREAFLYNSNTSETYEREKEIYKEQYKKDVFSASKIKMCGRCDLLEVDNKILEWATDNDNTEYIELAMEMQSKNISANEVRSFIKACSRRIKGL